MPVAPNHKMQAVFLRRKRGKLRNRYPEGIACVCKLDHIDGSHIAVTASLCSSLSNESLEYFWLIEVCLFVLNMLLLAGLKCTNAFVNSANFCQTARTQKRKQIYVSLFSFKSLCHNHLHCTSIMQTKLIFRMYVRLCIYCEKLELIIILKIAVFCCLAVSQFIYIGG